MEFKGTKGKWELIEHNWSDSSIMCGDGVICTSSIYDDATEENQEQLESEMSANMTLIASAPEMLNLLKAMCEEYSSNERISGSLRDYMIQAKQLIKKATEI